ncbi:MAG: translocation/assembly module TamB domain-containing protein [Pseudomonadota bacterium]|nr:translocation/assembly module TamB domain-containing protein [Pseudomonadota bacterium]
MSAEGEPPAPPAPEPPAPAPLDAPPVARRRWRLLSGCFVVFASVFGLLAAVLIGAAIAARTDGGRAWIRDQLVTLISPVNGALAVGALETDLFSQAVARDITLTDAAGNTVGHVDTLSVTYRLGGLVGRRLVVPTVRIEGLDLTLTDSAAGLDIAGMWDDGSPPTGKAWTGLGFDLVLPDVHVSDANVHYRRVVEGGEVAAAPAYSDYGFDGATLQAGVELRGSAVLVTGLELDAPATTPALGALSLGSDMRWDPANLWFDRADLAVGPNQASLVGGIGRLNAEATVGVQVVALHVDTDSLAPLVAGAPLPVTGVFDATGSVAGLMRAPTAVLEVLTPGGALHANAALDLREARPTWKANLVLDTVSIHSFVPAAPDPTVVGGAVTVDGAGLTWPDDLEGNVTFDLTSPELATLDALAARGTAHLAKGVIVAPAVHLDGPGMGVDGAVTVRLLEESGDARLETVFVDLARLDRFGAPGGRGRVTFAGNVRYGWGERLGFAADGAIRGSRVGWADILDATTVSGPVAASWSAERGVDATVGLDLSAVVPVAATAYSAATGRLDATFALAPGGALAVDGVTTLAGVVGPEVSIGSIDATVAMTRTSAGRMDGTADLTTSALAVAGIRSDRGVGHARFAGETIMVVLDLMDEKRTVVGLDGEIDVGALAIRARRLELAPTAELAWKNEGVQRLRLVEGGARDVHLRLVSETSSIAVDGGGQLKGLLDLRVDARDLRLDTLARLWPDRFAGYAGRVDLRGSIEGHASRPSLLVDLAAVGLSVPDVVQALDLNVQAVGGDRRLSVEGDIRAGGGTLARVDADLPFSLALAAPGLLTDGDVDIHVIVPPSGSEGWTAALPGVDLPTFRASAEIVLTGPVLDPTLSVVAAVAAPIGQQSDWVRVDLDGSTVGGLFQVRAVARERLERRAQVEGTVALHVREVVRSLLGEGPAIDLAAPESWVGAIELDVVPLRLPIQTLAALVELPASLLGDLSGGVHVSGDVRAPRVEGALFLTGGRLGEASLSPAIVAVIPTEGGYQVDANLGFGGPSAVAVTGFIPFAPTLKGDFGAELARTGLAIAVTAVDVPLAAISAAWPPLEDGSGTVSVNGTVTGSLADPAPDFTFGLEQGDFVLALTGVHYSEAEFSGVFTHDGLRIDGLHVRTSRVSRARRGKSEAPARDGVNTGTINGTVTAKRVGDRPVFDGKLDFDRAWIVDLPAQVLRTQGSLTVSDRAEKLRVTGQLAVVEGQLVVPERFFTKTSALSLDSDIEVIRAGDAVRETPRDATEEGLGIPKWLDLDVTVKLARNAFIDAVLPLEQMLMSELKGFSTIKVSAQLDGELDARIWEGELSLVGQLVPLRGTAHVFSVPFELTGDSISFTGRDFADPVLDLVAVHQNSQYGDVTTHITGTPSSLGLSFSSDNPDLAPDDVLAVLILGSPTSEVGAGESAASNELLTGAIASVASSLVKDESSSSRAFDVFDLSAGGVRVGKRVGDNMFLLGAYNWDADPTEENVGEVTLEVRLDRAWQFDFTTGTSGISSVGLTRKWRF